MCVVYHKLELSQIPKIKEYIYIYIFLMETQVFFRACQNIWLSAQTLKFWCSNMVFFC